MFIPSEDDFRRWIRESVKEELSQSNQSNTHHPVEEPLLSRNDIAAQLGISLVTLTDWMKKGLPFLRKNGRVYFLRTQVIDSMSHSGLKTRNYKKQNDE